MSKVIMLTYVATYYSLAYVYNLFTSRPLKDQDESTPRLRRGHAFEPNLRPSNL